MWGEGGQVQEQEPHSDSTQARQSIVTCPFGSADTCKAYLYAPMAYVQTRRRTLRGNSCLVVVIITIAN